MKPLPPAQPYDSFEVIDSAQQASVPVRWTAAQAAQLRQESPSISPWQVIRWQVIAGVLIALVAFLLSGFEESVGWSAAYGALVVVIPGAVLARGISSPLSSLNAMSAAMGFMVWEMVKIGLSIAMLVAATQVVANLSWPALLTGLVLTMKVYWLAAVVKPKPKLA